MSESGKPQDFSQGSCPRPPLARIPRPDRHRDARQFTPPALRAQRQGVCPVIYPPRPDYRVDWFDRDPRLHGALICGLCIAVILVVVVW